MFYLLQSSPDVTVPLWAVIVAPLVAASGTWLGLWLNRKRRRSVQVEDNKTTAEAFNLNVQSISELLQDLKSAREEANSIEAAARERAQDARKREGFLKEQIVWHEQLTTMARKAAHSAINELQRCIWAIHIRDEAIKEFKEALKCAEDLLTENKIKFIKAKITEIPVFEQTQYDDIVNYQELPLPPSDR